MDINTIISKRIPVTDLKPGDKLVSCNCIYGVTDVIPEGDTIFVNTDFDERRIATDQYVRIETF